MAEANVTISSLLHIPQSTISGIMTKWKQLGMTATQPQTGRPHKLTEHAEMLRKNDFYFVIFGVTLLITIIFDVNRSHYFTLEDRFPQKTLFD